MLPATRRVAPRQIRTTNPRALYAIAERRPLWDLLRELHAIRIRQGNGGWMDDLPPMLRRELETALTETGGIADDRVS